MGFGSVTVTSPLPTISSFSISPSTINSGGSATLTVQLTVAAPASGATISLSPTGNSAFPVAGSFNVQPGQSSGGYTAGAGTVSASTQVTITAGYNGSSRQATVTVNPVVPPPSISHVSPNPVTGSNSQQPFYIYGSGFTSQSTVTLWDLTAGQTFANRAISSQSSSEIVINPDFTTAAHSWAVEVINGSLNSGQYDFSVQAPSGFYIGETVAVSSTTGEQLHTCANLAPTCPDLVAMPNGTVMQIVGGPTSASGYIWWQLSGYVYGTYYTGWAVQNYLVAD
jgi:hypothetical protein